MQNTRIIKSACRMCHGGCQVLVHMEEDRVIKITHTMVDAVSPLHTRRFDRGVGVLISSALKPTIPSDHSGVKGFICSWRRSNPTV